MLRLGQSIVQELVKSRYISIPQGSQVQAPSYQACIRHMLCQVMIMKGKSCFACHVDAEHRLSPSTAMRFVNLSHVKTGTTMHCKHM